MLKLTRPFMHGPAVKRLQELLNLDVDGIYGPITEKSVKTLQTLFDLKSDGIVGPKTWKAFTQEPGPEHKPGDIVNIQDIAKPRLYERLRSSRQIIGVTLHQTGCPMPRDPKKWKRLNAHYGVTCEGLIVWANPHEHMIWHGNYLSPSTIGVEIEGNFPGVIGKPYTLWEGGGPACSLTPEQMIALEVLYGHLLYSSVFDWRGIYAHRQSSKNRPSDPGQEIWKEVAIPWARRLGIVIDPYFKLGKGRALESEWYL